jgi:photosynthetic reaction center cytochrome c subunit
MTNHLKLLIVLLVAVPCVLAGFASSSAERAEASEASTLINSSSSLNHGRVQSEKTADQIYKNIQVFKGMPASQLLGAMNFMAGSLGVSCNHCHVQNQFVKDDKPAKQVARQHVLLMRAVNDANFEGRTVVNCVTCHRGEARPASALSIAQSTWQMSTPTIAKSSESLPTVDQVLDRYVQALGGKARIEKLRTLTMRGVRVTTMGMDPPSTEQLEVYRKAPNKLLMTFKTLGNDSTQAFNGTAAWRRNNGRMSAIGGADLLGARRDADFYKDINFREQYPQMIVIGKEKVAGREAYVIAATLPQTSPARMMFGIQAEKLYFDAQTGLLVRRYMEYKTLLGQLPEATDYGDYKRVNGFLFPFNIRLSRPPLTAIQKFTEIKLDAAIDDERFDMPAQK